MTRDFTYFKKLGDDAKLMLHYEEALISYNKAIELRPQFWVAYYEAGDASLKLGNFLKAASYFWLASLYSRSRPEPTLMAARCLVLAEFYQEAINVFSALTTDQLDPKSALMYASALQQCQRPEEALVLEYIFKNTTDVRAKNNVLFDIFLDLHDFAKANLILATKEMRDSEPPAYSMLQARYFEAQGDLGNAKLYCRRAIMETLDNKASDNLRALPKIKPAMLVQEASIALLALERVLSQNKVNFFLAYGTLLGIVRDGEILPYDKDMDIGIFGDVDKEEIFQIFLNDPSFRVVQSRKGNGSLRTDRNIVLQHRASDITIDIFYFREVGDTLISGFYHEAGPVLWVFPKFSLTNLSYKGVVFKVPNTPELFFEAMYGADWRTPDKFFDSVLSAPNMLSSSMPTAELVGLFRLQRQLSEKNYEKAKAYVQQMLALTNDEWYSTLNDQISSKVVGAFDT